MNRHHLAYAAFLATLLAIVCTTPAHAQSLNWHDNGSNVYILNGNVGVNTTTPTSAVTLYPRGGATNSQGGVNFKLYEYAYLGAVYGSWATVLGGNVKASESAVNQMEYALSRSDYGGVAMYMLPSTGFIIHTAPPPSTAGNAFNSPRVIIDLQGNVGIGTMSPAYKLDVVGNANFSGTVTGGNIVAKYQDVAEWVPVSGTVEPGTVVVLDQDRTNVVRESTKAYDTTVAGIVSAQPGITLGEAAADKAKVATTGRVRVKVDATQMPVHVGDLLVTSETPGYAMRSVPVDVNGISIHRPGTIIGKALEPLPSGRGEILVLLSLQ